MSFTLEPMRLDKRIVVVADDSDLTLEMIKHFIEFEGASCHCAHDGAEAIDLVTSVQPDIILMDVQMPVMDGITAIKKLRESGVTTPIIAVTAMSAEESKQLFDAGATDYHPKPINAAQLCARISELT